MVAGYLIFSLYVPFIFRKYGAIQAGQIGLLMSLLGFLLRISNSFMQTNVPNIIKLISNKDTKKAYYIFKKNFLISLIFAILSCISLYISFEILRSQGLLRDYIDKFPDKYIILIFLLHFLANAFCSNLSIYSRAKNKEIFVKENVIMGIITVNLLFWLNGITFGLYVTIITAAFTILLPIMYYRKFVIEKKMDKFI
jgi:O-antigen/teichoic acid export membrane protein